VRRCHSLRAELAIAAAAVLAWQLARIPFEAPLDRALDAARDWLSFERATGIDIERPIAAAVHEHRALLDATNWFYSNMDEVLAFGVLAALRLVDPWRFPLVRTAFVLAHVPALIVVAAYPMAPPRWVPELPYTSTPPAGFEGGFRNSTAAAVSLHVGIPVLLAVSAIWMRPRAPLAWASLLYPALVFVVVVGTENHFVLDAVVGVGCAAVGLAVARLVHGRVPRGRPEAPAGRIVVVAVAAALVAFLINFAAIHLAA
jgi:PAP2 superfamily protein